ncbi:MAG: DUF1015 domain-containing protein [Verrucomicrobiae bacterium]|nr:DUF1015 domain-containing protein [Verrucomicrobiae bacterium]
MATILPFRALRARPDRAAEIAAPPYDVLSSDEAKALAARRPLSFLRVSKPEIELPPTLRADDPAVYACGAKNFRRLQEEGHLVRDVRPAFHLYRQEAHGHAQTGFVALASCAEVERGLVKRHEFTRPDKENDRMRHIETLGAQTGPAFLLFRDSPALSRILEKRALEKPEVDFVAEDGVRHTTWTVADPAALRAIEEGFHALPALYIADGHHRTAAAVRLWQKQPDRAAVAGFLAVLFPADTTRILAYNRFVLDRVGLSEEAFLDRIREVAEVADAASPIPRNAHEVCFRSSGRWRVLRWRAERIAREHEPVERLDVALLQKQVLAPILGIGDPRTSERIRFVGGIRGTAELEKLAAEHPEGVAFSMHPTSVADLMAIADRGQVMPPKSTWFEPKLRDGLFNHVFDG